MPLIKPFAGLRPAPGRAADVAARDPRDGTLITADAGSVTLSAGSYVFEVKGNGLGSGNSVDYSGEVTFTATMAGADSIVAPVPEPASIILTAVGLSVVGGAVWRRRRSSARTARRVATSRR